MYKFDSTNIVTIIEEIMLQEAFDSPYETKKANVPASIKSQISKHGVTDLHMHDIPETGHSIMIYKHNGMIEPHFEGDANKANPMRLFATIHKHIANHMENGDPVRLVGPHKHPDHPNLNYKRMYGLLAKRLEKVHGRQSTYIDEYDERPNGKTFAYEFAAKVI